MTTTGDHAVVHVGDGTAVLAQPLDEGAGGTPLNETGLALDNGFVLPSPLARLVSIGTRSTSHVIRITGATVDWGWNVFGDTKLSALRLGHAVVNDSLIKAARDAKSRRHPQAAEADAAANIERRIEGLNTRIDHAIFWLATGFHSSCRALLEEENRASTVEEIVWDVVVFDNVFEKTTSSHGIGNTASEPGPVSLYDVPARNHSSSYGSMLMGLMGVATSIQIPGLLDDTPEELRSFARHTRCRPEDVLLSSFLDAQGGSDATDSTGSGIPLVHYVSLDHEFKAVVLVFVAPSTLRISSQI
ncbi:hypothetical protein N657DRAFT_670961 [Parathielavia appendiculata]|uniref:Uncharacterized protein n=1 Tax=Parathielavia appendiculata TaxID=2587402 RepID=A0AAN6U2C4_9PEZI|nr:hypothetical protein N657DRAFT_670961 [Parathielavia appendiculata]